MINSRVAGAQKSSLEKGLEAKQVTGCLGSHDSTAGGQLIRIRILVGDTIQLPLSLRDVRLHNQHVGEAFLEESLRRGLARHDGAEQVVDLRLNVKRSLGKA